MKSLLAMTMTTALLMSVGMPARCGPVFGSDDLQRNGGISRHLWKPDFADGEIAGHHVSAGLAIGLRDMERNQLGRSATPEIKMNLGGGKSLSLLPAGGGGTMLVLQVGL